MFQNKILFTGLLEKCYGFCGVHLLESRLINLCEDRMTKILCLSFIPGNNRCDRDLRMLL